MKEIEAKKLLEIKGGFDITGTILNAIVSGIKTIFEIGKSIGSAVRRIESNNLCSF